MNLTTLRKPIGLTILLPLYKFGRLILRGKFERPTDPAITAHASAMLTKGNWMYRLMFPRFFKKMRYELPHGVDLQKYAKDGTLVYIGTQIRELEYNYFGHLFKEINLPLSIYANGFSLRRWMVWKDLCASLHTQFETISEYGGIPHPGPSGELTNMISSGYSVLLSLAGEELQDESLLLSESNQLLMATIRAQQKSDKPVYLVPLNFLWDRRPRKEERSIIDLLFGEKERPGKLRKLVLFWRNYKRRALVQVGTPIDLKSLISEPGQIAEEELAAGIRSKVMDAINAERRTITGPPARPQRWFVERVLADPWLEKRLSEIAVEKETSLEQLNALARKYTKEIASNINYTVVEVADRILDRVFKKLYENFSVDTDSLAQIKGLSAYTPLVFVPNHRSHVDYLLLSYIFYHHNMIIPHIAAGLNLAFWPLGPIFRRLGAFFIRRAFHGNLVYRAVIKTYLSVLLQEGYNQEFFIEGGRSRTGKLRPPRMGMLSMLTDSVIDGSVQDLIYVPVSITYEHVLEHKAYLTELEGEAKKAERVWDIFGLTKFLRRHKEGRGTIYVRFGTPVSLSGAAHELDLTIPISTKDKAKVVNTTAHQICHEINRHVVVTPLSITAMALLLKPKRAVTFKKLKERTTAYLEYLRYKDVEISKPLRLHPMDAMMNTLAHLTRARLIRYHHDPEFPFYEVLEDKRISIDYYKNTAVHYLASLAFLCTILKKRHEIAPSFKIRDIADELELLQRLFQFEFRFRYQLDAEERLKHLIEFLEQKGVVIRGEDDTLSLAEGAIETLDLYSDLVKNVLDAYKGALNVLKRSAGERHDEKTLIKKMLDTCPRLFLVGLLSHREAVTKENFAHALAAFRELGAINIEETTKKGKVFSNISINEDKITNLQQALERVT